MYGIADNKFVITTLPHKLIDPNTNTYPIKAVAIITINIITPIFHTMARAPV